MSQTTRPPHTAAPHGSRDGRRAARDLILLCALLAVTAAAAQAQDASSGPMGERINLNGTVARSSGVLHVSHSISEPLATAGPLPPQDALRADRTQTARQTMLWAEHARTGLGVGIGVEQRRPYGSAALASMPDRQPVMEGGMLAGVSLATGPRSHLIVQTPVMNATSSASPRALMADDPLAQEQGRQVRMGLVFNTKKPLADLRQGFRMELSGQTTLAVKPRGGKIGLAFQKIF